MSSRHEAREFAVQFLFQREFNADEIEPALVDFWEERKPIAKTLSFAESLIYGVEKNKADLDKVIQGYAANWDINRMGVLDRTVIRIAAYEMLHRPDIPPVVSINEAVDLAKAYSSRESGKFVNGILDEVRKHISRPARTVQKPGQAEPAAPEPVNEEQAE